MTTARETAINTAATGPKQVTVDGTSVVGQDIAAQIEADRYLSAKTAASAGRTGIRFFKIKGGRFES
jgi:hypothetical protein